MGRSPAAARAGGPLHRPAARRAAEHGGDLGRLSFLPFVPLWPFSHIKCTTKKALNEDQYAESGIRCCLALPLPCPVETTTRTRIYANGHATNGFASDYNPDPNSDQFPSHQWHRNPGSAGGSDGGFLFFAKKVG